MSFSAMGNPINNEPQRPPTISEVYFRWLYERVFEVWDLTSSESFTTICWLMHQVTFNDSVPHDDNRVADAAGFRNNFHEYAGSLGPEELTDIMMPDASVFEVLIALADRADFQVPLTRKVWFRVFLENLGLDKYSDADCLKKSTWPAERIINVFNNRAYRYNGKGGIFPLRRPRHDQRQVELWYQMGAYMTENSMY